MPTGDTLAVFLGLLAFSGSVGVAAYTVDGHKARNLWVLAGAFLLLAVLWLAPPVSIKFNAARLLQYLLLLMPLVVVSLVSVMVRDRGKPAQTAAASQVGRQRFLIEAGREAVTEFTAQARIKSFREWLERSAIYPAIRPHLSDEYKARLTRPRVTYAQGEGTYHPLAVAFLDELERLEKDWGLSLG